MSAGKIAACVTVLVVVIAGCGSDGDDRVRPSASRSSPTATASPTPAATPQVTATPTPDATAAPTAAPADPGEGDEAGNRVRVELTLEAGRIDPARVEVPAFLGLTFVVRNASGAERILQIDGRTVLELLPGASETADVEGLQPGEHFLTAAGGSRSTIMAKRP